MMKPSLNHLTLSWETLRRVVATTVAYTQRDPLIRKEFEYFHADPSDERFREGRNSGLGVKNVVAEAMRLHLPSKHIARTRRRTSLITKMIGRIYATVVYETKVVDIEAILRCGVWGMDSEVFRPERHQQSIISPEEAEAARQNKIYGVFQCR